MAFLWPWCLNKTYVSLVHTFFENAAPSLPCFIYCFQDVGCQSNSLACKLLDFSARKPWGVLLYLWSLLASLEHGLELTVAGPFPQAPSELSAHTDSDLRFLDVFLRLRFYILVLFHYFVSLPRDSNYICFYCRPCVSRQPLWPFLYLSFIFILLVVSQNFFNALY